MFPWVKDTAAHREGKTHTGLTPPLPLLDVVRAKTPVQRTFSLAY